MKMTELKKKAAALGKRKQIYDLATCQSIR